MNNLSFDLDYNIYTHLYEFVDPEDVAADALEGRIYEAVRLPLPAYTFTLADAGSTYAFNCYIC